MASEQSRLDAAVEVAKIEWCKPEHGSPDDALRAALLAALPVLLGEPVAWQYESHGGGRQWIACEKSVAKTFAKYGHATRALYAPDLGGGK